MALTFFKLPKHKHFNYKPVYWNKEKEEREKRHKSAMEESGLGKDYSEALRERMEMRWKRSSGARSKANSNLRLIGVMIILAFIFWFIFMR